MLHMGFGSSYPTSVSRVSISERTWNQQFQRAQNLQIWSCQHARMESNTEMTHNHILCSFFEMFLPVPSQFQDFQDWSLQIFKNILTTASIQACPMEDFSRPKGASVRRDRSFSRNISPLLSKSFKCLAMSWVIPVLVAAYLQRHVHVALTFTDIPNGPCFPLTYPNPPINMKVEMAVIKETKSSRNPFPTSIIIGGRVTVHTIHGMFYFSNIHIQLL